MRNDLRPRLAALAVAAVAVALLSGNVAGAQPAAGSQAAPPAAQAVAAAPYSAEAIGTTPGPDRCPRLHGTSQSTPNIPNSCGPPGTTSPPPPPPAEATCQLHINNPYAQVGTVRALGSVNCSDTVTSISLIVTLYKQRTGDSFTFDEVARIHRTRYGVDRVALTVVKSGCENTRYYAVAQATVNKPPSRDLGRRTSAIRPISCF
jgi:hypothetical protein